MVATRASPASSTRLPTTRCTALICWLTLIMIVASYVYGWTYISQNLSNVELLRETTVPDPSSGGRRGGRRRIEQGALRQQVDHRPGQLRNAQSAQAQLLQGLLPGHRIPHAGVGDQVHGGARGARAQPGRDESAAAGGQLHQAVDLMGVWVARPDHDVRHLLLAVADADLLVACGPVGQRGSNRRRRLARTLVRQRRHRPT